MLRSNITDFCFVYWWNFRRKSHGSESTSRNWCKWSCEVSVCIKTLDNKSLQAGWQLLIFPCQTQCSGYPCVLLLEVSTGTISPLIIGHFSPILLSHWLKIIFCLISVTYYGLVLAIAIAWHSEQQKHASGEYKLRDEADLLCLSLAICYHLPFTIQSSKLSDIPMNLHFQRLKNFESRYENIKTREGGTVQMLGRQNERILDFG